MNQPPAPWDLGSDDEDLDEQQTSWLWGGRKAFIFLVDVTPPMFEPDVDDDSTFFGKCIEAVKSFMLGKIMLSEKDLIGIVLYGTKHKGQAAQPNHVTTLQELEEPNAEKMKELNNIISKPDDFKKQHGHSDNYSIAEALWHCHKLVSNSKIKLSEKTILLLTNTDNPHATDRKLQHDARTRATDLCQMDIRLEVLPLGLSFKMDVFYGELSRITEGDDKDADQSHAFHKPSQNTDDILQAVSDRSGSKRSLTKILWSLGGDVKLAVTVYSVVKSVKMPPKVKLARTDNSEVQSRVQHFNATTGEEVAQSEITHVTNFGDKQIPMDVTELKAMKQITPPGLVLLGFKPFERVKLHHHSKNSLFIYPAEQRVKGSRTLFAALHQRCLERKVAAICYFTARRNARPSIVALLPQAEKVTKGNVQLVPPGFLLVFLPYADNIRGLEDQMVKCSLPENDLVSLAEKIIKKLKFRYKPSLIDNPKIQKHWAGIEALALGYDEPRETNDHALPNYDAIDEQIGDLAKDFMDMAFPGGFNSAVITKAVAAKRKSEQSAVKEPAQKKPKEELDINNMEDIARRGLVEKLKVPQLKEFLHEANVKTTKMKKDELVVAVYYHLGMDPPE